MKMCPLPGSPIDASGNSVSMRADVQPCHISSERPLVFLHRLLWAVNSAADTELYIQQAKLETGFRRAYAV